MIWSWFLLIICLLSGCKVSDDRDICCDGTTIYVRYIRDIALTDSYTEFIGTTEHFWFDEQGILLAHTLPKDKEIQHPSVNFSHGKYTLMVLGNRSEKTLLNYQIGKTQLRELLLQLNSAKKGNLYTNSDRLYWGLLPFEVYRTRQKHYICDMSNIHCRLKVTVKWKNNLPSQVGLYSLQLTGVPGKYSTELHPKEPKMVINPFSIVGEPKFVSSDKQVVHSFPTIVPESPSSPSVSQEILVPMSSAKLVGEFISFRYDDKFIPSFRVWKEGVPMMKEIDLTRFLNEIGWVPSKVYEQVLHLLIEIDPLNNLVTVDLEGDLNVKDWEDGGNINVNSK